MAQNDSNPLDLIYHIIHTLRFRTCTFESTTASSSEKKSIKCWTPIVRTIPIFADFRYLEVKVFGK